MRIAAVQRALFLRRGPAGWAFEIQWQAILMNTTLLLLFGTLIWSILNPS
jgi:hypothetical protein